MSEPIPPSETEAAKPKFQVPMRVWVIGGLVVFALLYVWVSGIRTESLRREAMARTVDTLVPALRAPLLEGDTAKLTQLLEAMAREGDLRRALVTNPEGSVLATTDLARRGERLEGLPRDARTRVDAAPGGLRVVKRVDLAADNPLGYLVLETKL